MRDPIRATITYLSWLFCAWTGAWLIWHALRQASEFAASDVGAFLYWTTAKVTIWVLPALLVMRASGRTLPQALGLDRLPTMLAWGLGTGAVVAAGNLAANGGAIALPESTWALVNATIVAPAVEEIAFRGAVLGALLERFRFVVANTMTAAAFVVAHVPGWYFQERLIDMLTTPIGGAASIFVLGWLFGWIVHASKTLGAGIIAHALNNATA